MKPLRAILIGLLVIGVVPLGACSQNDDTSRSSQGASSGERETATVSRAPLTPTLSASGAASVAEPYVILAPTRGPFVAAVRVGDRVSPKQTLGTVNGTEVLAPSDGTVTSVSPNGEMPQNFPVVVLRYTGFAATIQAKSFLRQLDPAASLAGRFQIRDGAGPQDCAAVVLVGRSVDSSVSVTESSAVDGDSKTDGSRAAGNSAPGLSVDTLQCLFPRTVTVMPGQAVIAVVTGPTIDKRLMLPLSAVAGRAQQGTVTKREEQSTRSVDVKLGASDGARIEILSGLNEGDVVELPAPNLGSKS